MFEFHRPVEINNAENREQTKINNNRRFTPLTYRGLRRSEQKCAYGVNEAIVLSAFADFRLSGHLTDVKISMMQKST